MTELTFHFWVALHERKYRTQLWVPFLRRIWPDDQDPKRVRKDPLKIRDLRNRIAHHEPVFAPKWRTCADLTLSRIEQLSPEQHVWISLRVQAELGDVLTMINSAVPGGRPT